MSEDLEIPKGNHFLFMRFQLFPEVFTEVTLTPVMTTQSNISRQITMKSLFCHQTFPLTSRLKIVALSWAGSTAGQFVAEMGTFLEDVTQQQGQIFPLHSQSLSCQATLATPSTAFSLLPPSNL